MLSRLRQYALRNAFFTLLGIVGICETLILQWGLAAAGLPTLHWIAGAGVAIGLVAANLLVMMGLRSLSRDSRAVYAVSRLYMVGTVGALISGPLLAAAFLAAAVPGLLGALDVARATLVSGGGAALALGFGAILWGWGVGQRRVVVEELDLRVRDLPPDLEGLRIAHVTDLHIGHQLRAPLLRRLVERVNAVGADLIVITGDIFDFDPRFIEEGCRELARLDAPLGVYAILGNHDVYTGREEVARGVGRYTHIHLLRDEWTALEVGGARLYLLGHEDPGERWTDRDSRSPVLEKLCNDAPSDGLRLLLAHRPAWFGQASELGVPVMLAGHTHGGQITLPRPFQHHNIARLIAHWTRGLLEDGDSVLYVNRGLGVSGPPVRLNCPREIAQLRLVRRG